MTGYVPDMDHLRSLDSRSLTRAQVNWLCDEIDRLRAERERFENSGVVADLRAERDALAEQIEDWEAELLAVEPAAHRIALGVEDYRGLIGSTRAALARYPVGSTDD